VTKRTRKGLTVTRRLRVTGRVTGRGTAHSHDREILRLAVPAFLALVAEPLFLLSDAAIVGHLGTAELAGLGIAGAVLQSVIGLCVFLAYGTTASVARHLGAGDRRGALAQGIDGIWLAVGIGIVATVLGVAATEPLVRAFGAGDAVTGHATTYLGIAFLGTTPLLVMLAATGVLRGLQDTRTPLVVAVVGNALNVALNLLLVYGVGLGIAGSALGSVLAQVASAVGLLVVVVRAARREGAPLRPDLPGVRAAAHAAVPLVIRTLTLRAALLVTTYAVTLGAVGSRGQEVELATHQLAMTLWTFLAFVLDAIAIAAQAITGRYLGAGDVAGTRAVTHRMVGWGVVGGVVTGLLLAAASPVLGALFTDDRAVQELLVPVLLVAALGQPVAGVVFVLDGVLIGAGDGAYLARGGLVTLAVYAPVALAAGSLGAGLVGIWVSFAAVFMSARLVVLLRRARGDAWLVTGLRPTSRNGRLSTS
jgi:putative MATE family efflux protein